MTTATAVAHQPSASASSPIDHIVLPQRFDVHEVPQFMSAIAPLAVKGTVLVINATEVRYLDRSGMDALIAARLQCMDHGGDLTLAAPSVAARVILELCGRYDALNPAGDVAEQQMAPAA